MSCPTLDDYIGIIFKYMPPWFGDNNPILEAILAGFGSIAEFIYCNLVYVKLQERITTATDEYLDFFAQCYFGALIRRCPNESDDSFRARLLKLMIAPRVTKQAMIDRLTDLTGRAPVVYESFGGENAFYGHSFYGHSPMGGEGPYQAWITAYRPIAPVDNTTAFLNDTAFLSAESYYGKSGTSGGCVTDEDILNTIEITKLEGTLMHVTILD